MLKDLTRDDWLSFLHLGTSQVPHALILRGTRNLRTRYEHYRTWFDEVTEIGSPNGLFEDVLVGRLADVWVGYASVYGAPMASEIAHVFGALGTRLVIQTGVCGALAGGMGAGDLVVATEVGCGDGAATCYLPGRERVEATPGLVQAVLGAIEPATTAHAGPIWTTAALLAEGAAEIDAWGRQGYLAVDMETAATFAVAEHFGMARVSLLTVFDNPREGAHLALTEEAKAAARSRGEAEMRRVIVGLIGRYGGS